MDLKRTSITTIPAKDWQIIQPEYAPNHEIISVWLEDAVGFVVEVDEADGIILATSSPFGVSGIPETVFATKSPSGHIEIAGERSFSSLTELLVYWRDQTARAKSA